MTNKKYFGECIISIICIISGLLFMGMVLVSLINILDYDETFCTIDTIKVPNSLPHKTYSENWASYDCVKRCDFETACSQVLC